MTEIRATRNPRVVAAITAGVLGYGALLARPAAAGRALLVDAVIGTVGIFAPTPSADEPPVRWTRWIMVTALGVVAFAAGRLLTPQRTFHVALSLVAVAPVVVASIAEEAFFRRWLYGWLALRGTGFAITGSAVAFAIAHAPAYGVRALPIDLAAGLLFGWQRAATGGWTASAATHLIANLLQLV
jgi:membrane protease YdiL (CAAX protease family)